MQLPQDIHNYSNDQLIGLIQQLCNNHESEIANYKNGKGLEKKDSLKFVF